ncbi:MAG TPA: penicillin-binding transpeptidase domain-containing protein [Pyrinomonadaceae bacterium]|jgi:membrane peptidoglycan carboxypeptidase
MIRTPYPLRPFLVSLCLIFCLAATNSAAAKKTKAKPAAPAKASKSAKADKKSKADNRRDRTAAKKSSAKETRAERASAKAKKEERAERGRSGRLSKRERLAQARREAEERRRREEAARRAEIARQAAIARQRAFDKAIRDEVQQNILRDDATGEDPEVRRVAVQALGYHAASVVVMNPRTGQVYTIVNQEWGVRRGFKPCSTIKLISGLAGVMEGVIDPTIENAAYNSNRMNLTDALAYSHNGYFQQVGRRVGFDRLSSYARQLGYGERTGINHVNEYAGRVPLFKNDVGILRMSSHGDDFEVTPLQLATLASVFASGGTLVTPHLPRTPQEAQRFKTEVRRQLNIPQEALRRMLPGMIGSVNYGTGRKAHDSQQTIAGKTGTCIGANGVWDGSFTSFAPVEDPQLAVAVIGRGPDARHGFPASVAGQIYRALAYRFGKTNGKPSIKLTPEILAPRPKVDPSALADTEAQEDSDADDAAEATPNANENSRTADGLKRVLLPVETRPTGVTTRPAATTPSPAPAKSTPSPDGRPRRVLTNQP